MTDQEKLDVYTIDILLKYRDVNRLMHPNFEKYFVDQVNNYKYRRQDPLDRSDVRTKLNYIMTKSNISNEDETLYKNMMKILNKVNNNNDNSLQVTLESLTTIKYTKLEHFQKLADLVVDKALNEPTFCSLYASICSELACYYIEINPSKKVYFRHTLMTICQTTFESFLNNCENIERTRLIGLMRFLGELYTKGLLPAVIVKGCFDRLSLLLEKVKHAADGISELSISTYRTLLNEQQPTVAKHIKERLNSFVDNGRLHIQSKFVLQNAIDKIEEINKSLN
jgi:hypothetical protein